jgi:aspartate/methionine/tyrosine aminotransferase
VRLIPRTLNQTDSPIGATYALLERRSDVGPALLDLAQAAPAYPTAREVSEHVAAAALRPHAGDYVELAGLPRLRSTFAAELSAGYRGRVQPDNVLVTAGCNQAFCLVTSTLAAPGDEIILPLPYYFNHDMWLRLDGLVPVYVEPGIGLMPSVRATADAITPRTRAIVLVSPGNPTGVTVDPGIITELAALARSRGLALILDETYRSFRGTDQPAHALFAEPGWPDTVVSLHSFSKDLAIPGYRVGAVVASPALIRESMKLLDCVAICAPRIGQEAAWAGLTMAARWRHTKALEIAGKQRLFEAAMTGRPGGFELVTNGAYFGWIRHPFTDRSTDDVVCDLVIEHGALVIAGTAFLPDDRRMLRVSIANLEPAAIAEFARRLAAAGR